MTVEQALDELVTGGDIAKRLGVSRQRVHQLREKPDFPRPIGRIGNALVWRWADVEEWARAHRNVEDRKAPAARSWEDLTGAWRDHPELGRQIREDRED